MRARAGASEATYDGHVARKLQSTRETAIQRGKRWARNERQGEWGPLQPYIPYLWFALIAIVVGAGGLSMTLRGSDWGPELAILALAAITFIVWRVYRTWLDGRERRDRLLELRRRRRTKAE